MRSFVLGAGIDGRVHAGEEYVKLVGGYREAVWKK